MRFDNHIPKADGFRFINHLHTTARQLEICSQIIIELNGGQKLHRSLFDAMTKWSLELEHSDLRYAESKGKLTTKGTPTTAFNHYLELCKSLNLITEFNKIYANSRLAYILLYFEIQRHKTSISSLSEYEIIFYLFLLLYKDADGIFLVLDILVEKDYNQQDLQKVFLHSLNNRLTEKRNTSSSIAKQQIGEKYRTINFIWQNPEKYAEHLLIPRCEWLNQLGIVSITKLKSATVYSLTERGILFTNLLPKLFQTNLLDIDEEWLVSNAFKTFSKLYCNESANPCNAFSSVHYDQFGRSLETATNVIKSSNLFRIPAFDAMLFICMNMLLDDQVIIDFSDITILLNSGFSYNEKQYFIKNTGRINESYISTRPFS